MAVLDLFRSTEHVAEEHLRILCDSQYVINCITKWMPGWKRKGWRKADGKPVLNVELLQGIDAAIKGRHYSFEWVKGHAGHELNEAADVRARAVATAFQRGTAAPEGPGFPGMAVPGLEAAPAVLEEEPDLFSSLLEEEFEPVAASVAEQVVALERELLSPAVRADAGRLAVLLDPEFEEFGTSGRMWTRDAVIASLAEEPAAEPSMEVLNVDVLDDRTALLTYRTSSRTGSQLRSSLWRRTGAQWRVRFHQGTPEA